MYRRIRFQWCIRRILTCNISTPLMFIIDLIPLITELNITTLIQWTFTRSHVTLHLSLLSTFTCIQSSYKFISFFVNFGENCFTFLNFPFIFRIQCLIRVIWIQ
eukprot:629327_1